MLACRQVVCPETPVDMQWARAVSPIQLLEQNDPIFKWRAQMFDKFRRVVEPTVGFQQSLKAAK